MLQLQEINESGFTKYISQKISTRSLFGCDYVEEPFLTLTVFGQSSQEINISVHNAIKYGYTLREIFDVAKQFMYNVGAYKLCNKNESFFIIGQKCIPTYFIRMLHGEQEPNVYAQYGLLSKIKITKQDFPEIIRDEINPINDISTSTELSTFCRSAISNFLYDLKNSREVQLCGLRYNLGAVREVLHNYNFTQVDYFADIFQNIAERDRAIIILALFDIYNLSQLCNFIDDADTYNIYFKHAQPALQLMGIAEHEVKNYVNLANASGAPIAYDGMTKATNLILFFAIYTNLIQNNETVYEATAQDNAYYKSVPCLYAISKIGGLGLFARFILN